MLYYSILIQSRLENPDVPIKCPIHNFIIWLLGLPVKVSV